MDQLNTKVKCDLKSKVKHNAFCTLCGMKVELFRCQINTHILREFFDPDKFQILFSATTTICSVCSNFFKKLEFLHNEKQNVNTEIEHLIGVVGTGLLQGSASEDASPYTKEEPLACNDGLSQATVEDFATKVHTKEMTMGTGAELSASEPQTDVLAECSYNQNPPVGTTASSSSSIQVGNCIPTKSTKREKKLVCSHEGCGVKFLQAAQLRKHEMLVHEKIRPLVCYFCNHRASERRRLYPHMQTHHLNEKPWECPRRCGYRTACRDNFLMHIKRNHPEEKAKIPDARRREKAKKVDHLCSICGKRFASNAALQRHSVIHQTNREVYSCNHCKMSFLLKNSLKEHITAEHEQHGQVYPCTVNDCKRGPFVTLKKRQKHVQFCHPKTVISCKDCGKEFQRKTSYHYHRRHSKECAKLTGRTLSASGFDCTHLGCFRSFAVKVSWTNHMISAHNSPKNHPHGCEECTESFTKRRELQTHMAAAHGGHPCRVCDRQCSSFGTLAKHLRTSHAEEQEEWAFRCSYPGCKTTFVFQYMLIKHESVMHKARELFDCYFCREKFPYYKYLERHMQNRHLRERDRTGVTREEWRNVLLKKRKKSEMERRCKLCSKSFTQGHNYKKHMESHLPESQRTTYKCKQCSNTYLRPASLRYHLVADHGEPGRTFPCPYKKCKRPFASNYGLNRHIKVVHKGKKITCGDCGAECKNEEAYKYHKLHNKSCASLGSRDEPRFTCSHDGCSKGYSSRYLVRRHWEKQHSGGKEKH